MQDVSGVRLSAMRHAEAVSRVIVALEVALGSFAIALGVVGTALVASSLLAGNAWEGALWAIPGVVALIGVHVAVQFVLGGRHALRRVPFWMFASMWAGLAFVAWVATQPLSSFVLIALPLVVAALHLTFERFVLSRT